MKIRSLSLFVLSAAAACGGGNQVSLSVRAGSSTATALARPTSNALTLSNGIELTRVRIVLDDIKLEKVTGSASGDVEEDDLRLDPILLDLQGATLDGGVQRVIDAPIAAGTYQELKLKIHKPESSEAGVSADAALADMAAQGASIVVDGNIDGAAFTFTTAVEAEQKFEGAVTLGGGSNLTLSVDPTTWFGASSSARLDPRVEGNRSQIEENIKTSFKAYRDDDRDGRDDAEQADGGHN